MRKQRTLSFYLPALAIMVCCLGVLCNFTGCARFRSDVSALRGSITGNTYNAMFYSNSGEKFMTVSGENIDINENIVREQVYNEDGGWGYTKTVSSVLTITIDGSEMSSCGSTIIFAEEGLEPDVDYIQKDIESSAAGIGDYTLVANTVNHYKNMIGKPVVVIIQSQLGDPICAYSGDSVYYEICEDLPKTTKLNIDGKVLYIHRANFQIIDKDLLQ